MQAKSSASASRTGKSSQSGSHTQRSKMAMTNAKVEEKKKQVSHQRGLNVDEPNMSDTGLLVTVEDLINTCFGHSDKNVVNFKMLQMILRFLAQQLRILDRQVLIIMEGKAAAESDVSSESSVGETKKTKLRKKRSSPSSKSLKRKSESKLSREKIEAEKREKSDIDKHEKGTTSVRAATDESDKAKAPIKTDKGSIGAGAVGAVSPTKIGSIEVVTLSQFQLLEKAVNVLQERSGPLPVPSLPHNKKLKEAILKGTASLTETMQAMQVSARIEATEMAIGRLIHLITVMARSGALPNDLAAQAKEIIAQDTELEYEANEAKADKIITQHDALSKISWRSETWSRPHQSKTTRPGGDETSTTKGEQKISIDSDILTATDMQDIICRFRDEVFKTMNEITAHATAAADAAVTMATNAQDKIYIALSLDDRLSTLYGMVSDYTQQFTGLDAGLLTQITSFQEQLNQERVKLNSAMVQMTKIRNNAETAAVIDLTERYQKVVIDLDGILNEHTHLATYQTQMNEEIQSLAYWVEMMREQKADRDEVVDGLKDKADISRLSGMLMQDDFDFQRTRFELRVQMVYEKFRKQDNIWMTAVKDFTEITTLKANTEDVLNIRENLESELQDLHGKMKVLQRILGQPKAAVAMRSLRINASCGACNEPAVLDPNTPVGLPLKLPAIRPPPAAGDQMCYRTFSAMDEPPEGRKHRCRRWVGGSHTLITQDKIKKRPQIVIPPLSREVYFGLGTDCKYYRMEKRVAPCEECNQFVDEISDHQKETPRQLEIGDGDHDDLPPDEVVQVVPSPDLDLSAGSVSIRSGADDGNDEGTRNVIINVVEDKSASLINLTD